MKSTIKILTIVLGGVIMISSCKKDSSPAATVYYDQQDAVGRPAINTVFISPSGKDSFNTTIPTAIPATFGAEMLHNMLALTNPAGVYTTANPNNLLGVDAPTFISILAQDELSVSTNGVTTFYDGTASHTLTGRTLTDDVIHVELILLFGGPDGSMNPTLSDDHVPANDKAFLTTFPFEASPW